MFDVIDDKGHRGNPCITGVRLESEEKETIHYFLTLEDWRERRFKKILEK
ncbi:MAG: hypothetical protein SLAVMIC_00312 [uncultured marine phage]|uniref:Uncharacterized protein n=1 Tax=uncultured marine phage TaxID=707152 RepID=A0A8D9FQZ0_9VIRU|nr:MAG: hypothetical protein SLAVMIC_00312 [uncultured marine phage]